jgi:hypothetical protein
VVDIEKDENDDALLDSLGNPITSVRLTAKPILRYVHAKKFSLSHISDHVIKPNDSGEMLLLPNLIISEEIFLNQTVKFEDDIHDYKSTFLQL